jgi:ABC-type transporter MlaC component
VPTITTDLAGFGQWVLDRYGDDPDRSGVKVIHRTDSNYRETVQTVVTSLINLYVMGDKQMRQVRRGARATSREASWDKFIAYYDKAYSQALAQAEQRLKQS